MVIREFLGAFNLLRAQTTYIHKSTKIIVIYENNNPLLAIF